MILVICAFFPLHLLEDYQFLLIFSKNHLLCVFFFYFLYSFSVFDFIDFSSYYSLSYICFGYFCNLFLNNLITLKLLLKTSLHYNTDTKSRYHGNKLFHPSQAFKIISKSLAIKLHSIFPFY